MSAPQIKRPDLPEYMTWEELERLPEEIAEQIELWNGRVVWVRRGPAEHQRFIRRLTNEFELSSRKDMSTQTEHCWDVELECNVFLGATGKSDFVTPDFLVYHCLSGPYQDIRAANVVLVGEVLSPSNTQTDMDAKKARYADAGIPWYWEVRLAHDESAIDTVRAFGLQTGYTHLPDDVRPLHPDEYRVVGEWTRADTDGIHFDHPFPISIPWSDLEF
ncbi:Uma2 family endonuclease [Nocardia sp. NPDC051570]|uniref:Uma2 family endonuclease n=1 Tax=Nocardia sp. NPDC051570 TaxID=3364324 RepID=UPI0037A2B592